MHVFECHCREVSLLKQITNKLFSCLYKVVYWSYSMQSISYLFAKEGCSDIRTYGILATYLQRKGAYKISAYSSFIIIWNLQSESYERVVKDCNRRQPIPIQSQTFNMCEMRWTGTVITGGLAKLSPTRTVHSYHISYAQSRLDAVSELFQEQEQISSITNKMCPHSEELIQKSRKYKLNKGWAWTPAQITLWEAPQSHNRKPLHSLIGLSLTGD